MERKINILLRMREDKKEDEEK